METRDNRYSDSKLDDKIISLSNVIQTQDDDYALILDIGLSEFIKLKVMMNNKSYTSSLLEQCARWYYKLIKIKYLRGYDLNDIKMDVESYLSKMDLYLIHDEKENNKHRKTNEFFSIHYIPHLTILSMVYLLEIEPCKIDSLVKCIRRVKKRDILLEYLIAAIYQEEPDSSLTAMKCNKYKRLNNLLFESDKEYIFNELTTFLNKEWFKNSDVFYWYKADKYDYIALYEGYFAFETAAIARILGVDLTRLQGLKYFPSDFAFYRDGIDIPTISTKVIFNDYQLDMGAGQYMKIQSQANEIPGFDNLKEIVIVEQELKGIYFKNLEFMECELFRVTFRGCHFYKVSFIKSFFELVDFYDCSFVECTFKDELFEPATFCNTIMYNCLFHKVTITEGAIERSRVKNTIFKNCRLDGTDYSYGVFFNCSFPLTRIIEPQYYKTTYLNCVFNKTKFINAEFDDKVHKDNDFSTATFKFREE